MYDEKGRYIGVTDCEHYGSVVRFVDKQCCGGSLVQVPDILCKKRGEIGSDYCNASCADIKRVRKVPARS